MIDETDLIRLINGSIEIDEVNFRCYKMVQLLAVMEQYSFHLK